MKVIELVELGIRKKTVILLAIFFLSNPENVLRYAEIVGVPTNDGKIIFNSKQITKFAHNSNMTGILYLSDKRASDDNERDKGKVWGRIQNVLSRDRESN